MSSNFNGLMTRNLRVQNAMNFIRGLPDCNLFLGIGRTQSWGPGESDPGFVPPIPDATEEYLNQVWNELYGVVKIQPEDVKLVVARRDWGDPTVSDSLIFNRGDIVAVNTIPNVNGHPQHPAEILVYKCVEEPATGTCSIEEGTTKEECLSLGGEWTPTPSPGGVDNIPRGTSQGFDSGDGYIWDYLYAVPARISAKYVTDDWMAVPTPEEIRNDLAGWGLDNEISQGDKYRVPVIAGATTMAVFGYVANGDFPGLVKDSLSYRTLTLMSDPLLFEEGIPKSAQGDSYNASELVEDSGVILYIENRGPISKGIGQTEEFIVTFDF